jgi:hypothetical protein
MARIESLEPRIAPAGVKFSVASIDGSNGFVLESEAASNLGGYSVSSAGDVNGDGVDDLLIGAPDSRSGGPSAAYVVFGTPGPRPASFDLGSVDGSNGFRISGATNELLGFIVTPAGDVNGDGFDDVFLGARSTSFVGAAYVVFGKSGGFASDVLASSLDGTDGFKISGFPQGAKQAFAMRGLGDINGDGFDDLIIGQPRYDQSFHVILGNSGGFAADLDVASLNGTNGFSITGDGIGFSASGAGDVNGDGFADIVIGSPNIYNGAGVDSGGARIVFGRSGPFTPTLNISALNGTDGFTFTGLKSEEFTGYSVSSAGDVNGDGFADIIIGTSGYDRKPDAYVIFGKSGGFAATLPASALDGSNGFIVKGAGSTVRTAGDFNGDGFDDLFVGGSRYASTAFLVFGHSGAFSNISVSQLDPSTGLKITGGSAENYAFGSAGDVNGDGFTDLILGSPIEDSYSANPGKSYVVFGRANAPGKSVSFVDVDGDVTTIKVSKGQLPAEVFTIGEDGTIQVIDLTRAGSGIGGANLTIKVDKAASGDGFVNVGAINATGLLLGKVKIKGDLGQIDVGVEGSAKPGLKSLTIQSLGVSGSETQPPGTIDPLTSQIFGSLPKLTVKADVQDAIVDITGAVKNVKIGGNLNGTPDGELARSSLLDLARNFPRVSGGVPGSVNAAGGIGTFSVKGSINGGTVTANGDIGSVNVGGDLNGGAIAGEGRIRVVKVLGAMRSEDPTTPVVVAALARIAPTRPADAVAIDTLRIQGDLENARILLGYNQSEIGKNPDASAGKVLVKGNWTASSLVAGVTDPNGDGFGVGDALIEGDTTPQIVARIASIVIKGTAAGTPAGGDHFGITAVEIGKLTINGEKVALQKNVKDDILLDVENGDFRVVEV